MTVNTLLQWALFNIVIKTQGLVVHPSVIENNILTTAAVIQNTTNELFLAFKLKGIKKNPQIRQYLLIHNFFSSLTLQDHDALNRIALESRYNKTTNNETYGYMDVINDLLDEEPSSVKYNEDEVQENVGQFLKNLDYLKNSAVNDNYFINNQIVNILGSEDRLNQIQEESVENDTLMSDSEFWVPEQSGRRIYRGDKTKIKYFPFMASIQIFNQFQCGGCIIKSDLVISAASCLQLAWNNRFFRENPAFLSVRVGSNFYKGGGESIPVLEVYFHPEYSPKILKNNICILRLVRRLNFRGSRRVKKIDFDKNPSHMPVTTDGVTIVGWGVKDRSNVHRNPWSHQLAFSVLDIYPMRECQDVYSSQYVTHKNFCAGFFSKGGGACNGDVGGPGIAHGVLAGIVSFGSPNCGTPDAPTVFTKLGYYTDWIQTIMQQEVPHIAKRTTLQTPTPRITAEGYNTLKPTTFSLAPIFGKKWKPIPINQVEPREPLRNENDEDLFKEFLASMYGSKEAKEYKDLFVNKEEEKIKKKHKTKHRLKKTKKAKVHKKPDETVLSDSEQMSEAINILEATTQPYYHFTALDKNFVNRISNEVDTENDEEELNKTIMKVIENMDVDTDEIDKVVETSSSESESPEVELNKKIARQNSKSIDDSILTLLYLSDTEKKGDINSIDKAIDDFDENVNDGLSIAIEGFNDLPLNHNGTGSLYNFLPKDEMYEFLAEAIEEVVKNKNIQ